MRQITKKITTTLIIAVFACAAPAASLMGQESGLEVAENKSTPRGKKDNDQARAVVIPITPRMRALEVTEPRREEDIIVLGNLIVREDGEERKILSIRSIGNTPLALAVLIQDDVVPAVSNEIKAIGEFIRTLPKGSRVLVGYIKNGSLQVRQKFTNELDKAVKALRIPLSSASAAPFNPYIEIREGLKRFESLPSGRRAMLVVTDGLDNSRGARSSSAGMSVDLQRAIREAQRRSVAVYAIYAPTVTGTSYNSILVGNAQSSLEKLTDETGGRAFIQGTTLPVSFDPFLRELGESLFQQVAVTFLSTSSDKGFHRLEVSFERPGVEVDYPAGYTR